MDETRVREIIREEIVLAMTTLGRVAGSNAGAMGDDQAGERDGSYALQSAAGTFFESAYEADCAVADEQRALAAERANPFDEPEPADPAVQAVVRTGVLAVLKEMQDAFYASGLASDYSIAERLGGIIATRERYAHE